MSMVYPTDTSCCALCEQRIRTTRYVCLYVVNNRAALGYALCMTCGKKAHKGLPPDQLRKLDQTMEAHAQRLGVAQTH